MDNVSVSEYRVRKPDVGEMVEVYVRGESMSRKRKIVQWEHNHPDYDRAVFFDGYSLSWNSQTGFDYY